MTEGARFWRVIDGKLVSPFAGDVLPDDGVLTAQCDRCHPPGLVHRCGVAYYFTREDALTAARWLDGEPFAITTGVVIGPSLPDTHLKPYDTGAGWVNPPASRRARGYEVVRIWTDETVNYRQPVYPVRWM